MQKFCMTFLLLFPLLYTLGDNSKTTAWTEDMLKNMTLNEKIGQLFMIAVYSNKNQDYENSIEQLIREYQVGGLIFFQGEPVRQAELVNRYQKASKYPLLIGMDTEYGIGWRLKTGMEFPQMMINGALHNDTLLYRLGQTIARHCKEVGIHVNFAPVADVNNNPKNPVIGMRSFGEDPDNVYRKAAMYIAGSISENVLPVAKHFPGHGDTETDSHYSLPLIRHSLERLDSIELYPFKKLIQEGIPAIMTGHLNVKALDTTGCPASLSPRIVQYKLRQEFGFNGLCFTDALNMKGVTQGLEKGEAEMKALLAGNDILLFPENIGKAVKRIKQAIADSLLTEQEIDTRCRKILRAKYQYVLPHLSSLKTQGLWRRLHQPEDFALKQTIYQQAITLVKNENNLLPLKNLDTLRIASLNFGADKLNTFQTTLSRYAPVQNYTSGSGLSEDGLKSLLKKLAPYNCIIIYNNSASNKASRHFGYSASLARLLSGLEGKKVILCHPGIPYGLSSYIHLPLDALIVSYEDHLYSRSYAAQAIFGGIPVNGQLPVSINSRYPAGFGLSAPKTRLGYALPEMCGISSVDLEPIDSLCQAAIRTQATPGCQVLVAKNGYVIYNKAFGYHTYEQKTANHTDNIYDIASVTKIAATLPVIMKLYDEKRISLDSPASGYYPALLKTNKEYITLKEILTHNAGLKTFMPAFTEAIDQKALSGRLFTTVPTKTNTLKLKSRLYVNPHYQFRDSTLSRNPKSGYVAFTPGLYIYPAYRDTVLNKMIHSELNPKKEYAYSDLGFIFLQHIAETITNTPLDTLCKNLFFNKLGTYHTDFLANERLPREQIVPSCFDQLYRKKEIKGYVHDPMAALTGGIAGHAGLFSTAEDLAKIMAMYLGQGSYGDETFLKPATVALFTDRNNCFPSNRRGLGFDKPEPDEKKPGPTCKEAPAGSFGHTGFTGTLAWADPDNDLIYIFLSNRTYPNEFNTKLSEENIRTQIQSVIYRAIRSQKEK